jgi:hypothetical protein
MRSSKESREKDLLHELGYESQDVDAAVLLRWLVYLALFLLVMSGSALGIYTLFVPSGGPERNPDTALTGIRPLMPPAGVPLLQKDPRKEMQDFRRAEDRALDSYGYAEQGRGNFRIPIDQAIDLTLRKGLPARPSPEPPSEFLVRPVADTTVNGASEDFTLQTPANGQPAEVPQQANPQPAQSAPETGPLGPHPLLDQEKHPKEGQE